MKCYFTCTVTINDMRFCLQYFDRSTGAINSATKLYIPSKLWPRTNFTYKWQFYDHFWPFFFAIRNNPWSKSFFCSHNLCVCKCLKYLGYITLQCNCLDILKWPFDQTCKLNVIWFFYVALPIPTYIVECWMDIS